MHRPGTPGALPAQCPHADAGKAHIEQGIQPVLVPHPSHGVQSGPCRTRHS